MEYGFRAGRYFSSPPIKEESLAGPSLAWDRKVRCATFSRLFGEVLMQFARLPPHQTHPHRTP